MSPNAVLALTSTVGSCSPGASADVQLGARPAEGRVEVQPRRGALGDPDLDVAPGAVDLDPAARHRQQPHGAERGAGRQPIRRCAARARRRWRRSASGRPRSIRSAHRRWRCRSSRFRRSGRSGSSPAALSIAASSATSPIVTSPAALLTLAVRARSIAILAAAVPTRHRPSPPVVRNEPVAVSALTLESVGSWTITSIEPRGLNDRSDLGLRIERVPSSKLTSVRLTISTSRGSSGSLGLQLHRRRVTGRRVEADVGGQQRQLRRDRLGCLELMHAVVLSWWLVAGGGGSVVGGGWSVVGGWWGSVRWFGGRWRWLVVVVGGRWSVAVVGGGGWWPLVAGWDRWSSVGRGWLVSGPSPCTSGRPGCGHRCHGCRGRRGRLERGRGRIARTRPPPRRRGRATRWSTARRDRRPRRSGS